MRDLPRAEAIIRAVVRAVSIPVTVKMRTGWNETEFTAPELAKRAEAAGAAAVTVHGRTREQFYSGKADLAKNPPSSGLYPSRSLATVILRRWTVGGADV
jgi:tRNA-dihydrouridine synthase